MDDEKTVETPTFRTIDPEEKAKLDQATRETAEIGAAELREKYGEHEQDSE